MANDIIVSEMTSASQINTNDLMIMTQPDLLAETGYSTKKGTVLQVANKMLKGTEYLTDLPDFTDKTVLGGLEELKGDLTALLPVNTASGAIANFDTDLSLPLVDCKANIVASQASGTPTPSTPLPISGFTSCTISVADENMSVQDTYTVSWQDEAGTVYGGVLDVTRGKLHVTYGYVELANVNFTNFIAASKMVYGAFPEGTKPATANDKANIICSHYKTVSRAEVGYSAPYTVTGIGIDTGGNIFVTSPDSTWASLSDAVADFSGVYMAYELSTPFDIDLTPIQINALIGVNNVYNDTNGDTDVKYKEGIQHYIDKKIAATQALIL